MTTIDQKRMLKLAGLLKEGIEEWIDEEEGFPSLEETYIDNLGDGSVKESLEEAPPPSDPGARRAAGLKPLPTKEDEMGPFGEKLPRGKTFGAETLKANPGLVELHEVIRSLVREVLLEKIKKED